MARPHFFVYLMFYLRELTRSPIFRPTSMRLIKALLFQGRSLNVNIQTQTKKSPIQ